MSCIVFHKIKLYNCFIIIVYRVRYIMLLFFNAELSTILHNLGNYTSFIILYYSTHKTHDLLSFFLLLLVVSSIFYKHPWKVLRLLANFKLLIGSKIRFLAIFSYSFIQLYHCDGV